MSSLKKVTQKGFTIVELLIVIVVIGILAALVITTYSGIQQRARDTKRQTDLKAIKSQLEAYYTANGAYPGIATDGTGLGSDSAQNVVFIKANMKGLDKEALHDPKGAKLSDGTNDYSLAATPTANKYAYQPTNDTGGACTTAAADCTKYTLTAKPEASSTDMVVTNN